jgi:RNA polymerase sigma factor (TIGR02999 family)
MADVTQILSAIEQGDPRAAEELLPLVYNELRQLASKRLRHERPGQTLDATALVHEAFLRLVKPADQHGREWDSRGHFFAAAAEAMRRILVENARRKGRLKHGGDWHRVELNEPDLAANTPDERVLAIDESLVRLAADDPQAAEVVKLRFFVGFSIAETAEIMDISATKAKELWSYARAWLRCDIDGQD